MGAFKDKILDELNNNNYKDLYKVIKQIESDVDVANYISSGRGYYPKVMSTKDLEGMPEFRKALYSDIKTGKVDLDKEFGKDWYKNYEQIPSDQIKFVADKQGVSYGKLVHDMGKEATKKRRYDIAHDGTISGYITEFVAPRSVEAIERGESPSAADIGLDIGENVLYAAPWARVSAPLARFGLVGRVTQGAAGNALTPTIMETADAIAYDDSTNPRSEFSKEDVGTQTAVNAVTPWLLRNMIGGVGKLSIGKGGKQWGNSFMDFGTSRMTKEEVPYGVTLASNRNAERNAPAIAGKYFPDKVSEGERISAIKFNEQAFEDRQNILKKIGDKYEGNSKDFNFTDAERKIIANDPELLQFVEIDKLPTNERLMKEEALKNYLTNQMGTYWYDEQSPYTRIPVVGPRYDQYKKKQKEEEEEQALRDSILYDILTKYGEPRGL